MSRHSCMYSHVHRHIHTITNSHMDTFCSNITAGLCSPQAATLVGDLKISVGYVFFGGGMHDQLVRVGGTSIRRQVWHLKFIMRQMKRCGASTQRQWMLPRRKVSGWRWWRFGDRKRGGGGRTQGGWVSPCGVTGWPMTWIPFRWP